MTAAVWVSSQTFLEMSPPGELSKMVWKCFPEWLIVRARAQMIQVETELVCCDFEFLSRIIFGVNVVVSAGILTGMPDKFLRRVARDEAGIELPVEGFYGVGNLFLPQDKEQRELWQSRIAEVCVAVHIRCCPHQLPFRVR